MKPILTSVFLAALLAGCAAGPYYGPSDSYGYGYDYGPSYYAPGYYGYYGPDYFGPPVVIGGYYGFHRDDRRRNNFRERGRDFRRGTNLSGGAATRAPQWNRSRTQVGQAPTFTQQRPTRMSPSRPGSVVRARPEGRVATAPARRGVAPAPERAGS